MLFPSALMWIVFGAISAYVAKGRGKNPYLWFFLGMFFGIFGLIFLAFTGKPRTKPQKTTKDSNTIDITPKIDPSCQNKFWYYLDPDQAQNGPMSLDALIQAWREGKVSNKTYVWNDSLDDWKPFETCIKI